MDTPANVMPVFDDLDSCVAFMLANHHSEESIKVFGRRGGQYSLRDWIRRRSQDDDEPSTHTTGIHESDVTHDGDVADGQSVPSRSSQDSHHAQSRTINNAVLGYAAGYIHQRPNAEIKTVLLTHFTKDEIRAAKSLLWGKCHTLLDKNIQRVDTATRGSEEASADDILAGLHKLYALDTPPIFVVDASDISRLPKYEPGELLEPSMLQRLQTMEAQITQLHQVMDTNVARCIEVDDKVTTVLHKVNSPTYSAVTSQTPEHADRVAPLMVKLPPEKHGRRHTSVKSAAASIPTATMSRDIASTQTSTRYSGPSQSKSNNPNPSLTTKRDSGARTGASSREHARPARDTFSQNPDTVSDEGDSFQLPRYARRKIERDNNRKIIQGVSTPSGPLKGAPVRIPTRDLFIYRIDKSVDVYVLEKHVTDNGFTVLGLKCVSHEEATYKSFQLTVSMSDYAGLFNDDIWPEGICVRRFRPRRNPEHM